MKRSPRVLAAILGFAALVRIAHWWAVRDEPFIAQLAMDSAEYARWARELAAGNWWGSEPFFQAPLYPYLLGLVFRLAGARYDVVYLLQIALALVGLALLARAGARWFGRREGLAAAALGAIYLPFVFHEVQLVKEALALPLVALVLERLAAARFGVGAAGADVAGTAPAANTPHAPHAPITATDDAAGRRARAWLGAGAALGVLALLRENALLVMPFLAPFTLAPAGSWPRRLRHLIVFLLGVALPLLPVAARNAALGGGFLPTTFQGGVNFWIGNHAGADGTYSPVVAGKQVPHHERAEARRLAEQAAGRPLSGAEVSRHWLGRSLTWARAEPLAFGALQLRKLGLFFSPYEWPDAVDYYWLKGRSPALGWPGLEWSGLLLLAAAGLVMARGRWRRLAPLLVFEVAWIAATVAFFLFARYRLPAAPVLLLFAALPVVAAVDRMRATGPGSRARSLLAALALAGILVVPWLLRFEPRRDLVEFNLGRLAEERGDPVAARTHYLAALEADPGAFLAAMNLGTLAARAGDYDDAVRRFEQAVALEPDSDDAWANLGAARYARGEIEAANTALARALAINPLHPAARANRQLIEERPGASIRPPIRPPIGAVRGDR